MAKQLLNATRDVVTGAWKQRALAHDTASIVLRETPVSMMRNAQQTRRFNFLVHSDELEGLVMCHPHLNRLDGFPGIKVIINTEFNSKNHVAVISGGGSGHEPMHAGFVGTGYLAASAAGELFASPSVETVLAAIHAVTGPPGCVLIVLNYTGDRLNFGIAAERARAAGLQVEVVFVADDCAVESPGVIGPRGLAGTMLAIKAAGAAAQQGASLAHVAKVAREVGGLVSTIGAALTACTLPGAAPSTRLADDEMEMGLGLHGEPGAYTTKLLNAHDCVAGMVNLLVNPPSPTHARPLQPGAQVYVFVNSLGGSTHMELLVSVKEVVQQLQALKVNIVRILAGTMCTSLDMKGISVSVLRVDTYSEGQDALLSLLDAPTNAPAWPHGSKVVTKKNPLPVPAAVLEQTTTYPKASTTQEITMHNVLFLTAHALTGKAGELNRLDEQVGDGDTGSTLALGAQQIMADLTAGYYPLTDPSGLCKALARSCRSMGGSSGALYEILFTAAAGVLIQRPADVAGIAEAAAAGVDAMCHHGGATVGCRTMIDALHPAVGALKEAAEGGKSLSEAVSAAADAAKNGAEATKRMAARAGRSSYVPSSKLQGVVDPGAQGVAYWVADLAVQLENPKTDMLVV